MRLCEAGHFHQILIEWVDLTGVTVELSLLLLWIGALSGKPNWNNLFSSIRIKKKQKAIHDGPDGRMWRFRPQWDLKMLRYKHSCIMQNQVRYNKQRKTMTTQHLCNNTTETTRLAAGKTSSQSQISGSVLLLSLLLQTSSRLNTLRNIWQTEAQTYTSCSRPLGLLHFTLVGFCFAEDKHTGSDLFLLPGGEHKELFRIQDFWVKSKPSASRSSSAAQTVSDTSSGEETRLKPCRKLGPRRKPLSNNRL